ncbi:MAG: zinc-binding dehydrogenase [Gordonia sp. (in: high G+C Gram-positive bacteria)]|uniref:quinone oxidoreductase family protein n=1 Tax=Gordonia sp. (in: high G+C Gram-positive bacteria) TaxID=84139 RepID=UPI0039E40CFE
MTHGWVANGYGGLDDFEFTERETGAPEPGEVTVRVTAAGVNPADLKHVTRGTDPLPIAVGYEIAGIVTDVGEGTRCASGPVAVGDRVAAFRVHGGYAEELTVPAADVFVLPPSVDDAAAAGLLLAGCTAAELLHRSGARAGDTVLFHAASGAVGAIFLQLAAREDVAVVGTAGPGRQDAVTRFGGIAVPYGPGLAQRVRAAAPADVVAALDAAGTGEATAVSLDLVADRDRILTVAAPQDAKRHGFVAVSGAQPASAAYRDSVRGPLLDLLAAGELEVPLARSFPLEQAQDALRLVASGGAHGKVVLRP